MGWFRVLIETWWWVLLGALVGLVVGYLLGRLLKPRDVIAHPHFRALRAEYDDQRSTLVTAQARVDELERALAAQRTAAATATSALDACRAECAELRAATAGALEATPASPEGTDVVARALVPTEAEAPAPVEAPATVARGFVGAAPEHASDTSRRDASLDGATSIEAASPEATPFDAKAAASAYGARVTLDDLKIVEGIGPKIEELLHSAGIRTWRALAAAPVDALREVLRGGGDRFRMHDPSTWSEQAGLAADARFGDLKALQDRLTAGRG